MRHLLLIVGLVALLLSVAQASQADDKAARQASSVIDATEDQGRQLEKRTIRDLKRRRRRRRRRANRPGDDPFATLCETVANLPRKGAFSECLDEGRNNIPNQNNGTCSVYNDVGLSYEERRTGCQVDDGCQWYGPPNTPRRTHTCHNNPCFRINNGRCTIQHTGGRCVWWTKEMNKKFRGKNFPGCYTSPCQHPVPNTAAGCTSDNMLVPLAYQDREDAEKFAEPAPFQCTFCKGGIGCINTELKSMAQCYNLGKSRQCNSCNSRLGEACRNQKCSETCCGNDAYCKCLPRGEHAIDVIIGR